MERLEVAITGMTCGHCVAAVKKSLEELNGVVVERVVLGSAEVRYDPATRTVEDVLDAVADAGYQAGLVGGTGSAA